MLKIEEIREIIKMIDESSIQEFSYEVEDAKLKIKKEQNSSELTHTHQNIALVTEQPVYTTQEAVTLTEETKASQIDQANEATEEALHYDFEICSPMVGTLYDAPSPEQEPYVEVGSTVTPNSVVCIVEAMKLFNEIEAEVSGEIVEVLVSNGELVEYGQPLFRVKKK